MDQIVLKTVCINGTNVPYEGLPSGRGIKSANDGWGFDSPTGYKNLAIVSGSVGLGL